MDILTVIIVIVVIALIAQRILLSQSLRDVTYTAYPSSGLVEPDEAFELVSVVKNAKRLPELYIELYEPLPGGAELCEEPVKGRRTGIINKRFYMLPRQQVISSVRVTLPKRGIYMMSGATIRGGDFLGIRIKSRNCPVSNRIIVMPKRSGIPEINRVLGGFTGDFPTKRFILPDPVLAVGIREYTGREPMRDINWANSARAGQLMVKQYDYTHEPSVTVILNTALPPFPPRLDEFEECLSITRSVFEELERKKIKYGFITNTLSSYAMGRRPDANAGLGHKRLEGFLGWLGGASYATDCDFCALLEKAVRRIEQWHGFILITPEVTDEHTGKIERLRSLSSGGVLVLMPEKGR